MSYIVSMLKQVELREFLYTSSSMVREIFEVELKYQLLDTHLVYSDLARDMTNNSLIHEPYILLTSDKMPSAAN